MMEQVQGMTYADWCRKQQDEIPAPDAVAKKEPKNGEITHTYVAMNDAAAPMLAPVSVQPAMLQYPQGYYYAYDYPKVSPVQQLQPAMAYPSYCYAPYAYQGAVPANFPEETKSEKTEKSAKNVWIGRTKAQVDEDNIKIALREGVMKPNEMAPRNPKPDQLFWVVELNGNPTLRSYQTIEELGAGKWLIDPRYGNAYFQREKEGKK